MLFDNADVRAKKLIVRRDIKRPGVLPSPRAGRVHTRCVESVNRYRAMALGDAFLIEEVTAHEGARFRPTTDLNAALNLLAVGQIVTAHGDRTRAKRATARGDGGRRSANPQASG